MLKSAIFLLLVIVIISLFQNMKCRSKDEFIPYKIDIKSDGVKRSV